MVPESTERISVTRTSQEDPIDQRIDRALRKYTSVWIWSVLIGISTGSQVGFLLATKAYGGWKGAGVLLATIGAFGAIMSLMAFYALLKYLTKVLMPMFSQTLEDSKLNELNRYGFHLLARSLRYQLVAIVMGILIILTQYLLGALIA